MSEISWQELLNILTLKGSDTGKLRTVKDATSNALKFKICYDANRSYLEEWLAGKIKIEQKSASKSSDIRLAGNSLYKKGKDLESLNVYNLSVISAPYNTIEFALGLGNRSAVLGRLGHCEEAIQDIDLALQHGDSDFPRSKLLFRKVLLLHRLGLWNDVIDLVKSLFPDEDDICSQENADIKNAYFEALMEKERSTNVKYFQPEKKLPLPKGGESKHFQSASSHVLLKYSKEKGRHVVAKDDLNKSDIIFVEKPFALVVLPDQYQGHCHHCCKEMMAFVPCEQCTRALFCSVSCQKTSWSVYHQWECVGLEVCHSIGIAHLGLRVALMADSSEKYQQVFDLETHIDDMKAEDIYQYTITAVLLILYLKNYSSYFEHNPSLDLDEMGCRILQHIAQLICNGHAIIKVDSTNEDTSFKKTMTKSQQRIATAIYPSASMMNHSCDQNISNSFIDEYLIVRANRPIKSGEEVFNCYGPHYKTMNREKRQKVLQSQYFFECNCKCCSKPTESEFKQFCALLCLYCSGPVMQDQSTCEDCHRPQPILELVNLALTAQEAFHEAQKLFAEGIVKDAQTLAEDSVKISSKCLYKHNSDLRTYKDYLARLYAERGKYHESIALLEECVLTIEKQFGCNSVELSRELLKLHDVLGLDLKRMENSGLHNSEDYRNESKKLGIVVKQMQKIRKENVEATHANDVPDMVDALNSVQLF